MTYFNTPATYSMNHGMIGTYGASRDIYPTTHQEYKQIQKSQYSANPNYSKEISNVNKQNTMISSWGTKTNETMNFNPSIVKDGMVVYSVKSPWRGDTSQQGKTYFKSDSGRIVEQSIFSQPPQNAKYVEPNVDLFSDGPDFTDRDDKHLKKHVQQYFNGHNQFQTSEYVTPGQKIIKLDSGRTIMCDIKKPEKEIARCPMPKNDLKITPNKYSYNINNYNAYPLFGVENQNEPMLQQPKLEVSIENRNEINSNKINLQDYDANNVIKQNTNITNNMNVMSGTNNMNNIPNKETFINNSIQNDMSDELYKQILRTSAKAVSDWLLNFKPYKPWINNWEILKSNLEKTNLNISKLPSNDKEIAYTLDKGEIIKFRWQDNKRYISKDIFMYVLLHELTHESFPKSFQGHSDPFPQLLCLLCVAATEIGILNIENIPRNIYMSNGRPITSRESIKSEILFGINMLIEANKNDPKIIEYYQAKQQYVNKYS